MSLEDLFKSDSLLPIMFITFLILALVIFPIAAASGKRMQNSIYGDNEQEIEIKEAKAKVVGKGKDIAGNTFNINFLIFEFEDGSRKEFPIRDLSIYTTTVEGDEGTLRYRGKKFESFERNRNV